MDVLQPLSKKNLNEILVLINQKLPKSIRAHHYIYNYLKNCDEFSLDLPENTKISGRCKPKFYGKHNGIKENSTFIAIAITESQDYWVFLYTLENGKELYECLRNTARINWNAKQIYVSVESEHFTEVDNILNEKRNDWFYFTPERLYCLPKEIAISFDIELLSENLSLKVLTQNHAAIMNEMWPYNDDSSLKLIKSLLHMNGGTGLFKNDILVAWIATNDYFSPGFLNTLEIERRKGYANIVCKAECQRIARNHNVDILVYIVEGNIASETLFKKLGFEYVNELRWIEIKNN